MLRRENASVAVLFVCLTIALSVMPMSVFSYMEAPNARTDTELLSKSDLVVDGDVKSIESRKEADSIYSFATFLVRKVRKGDDLIKQKEIVVRYMGGEVETGKVILQSDQPDFAVGETARLYLWHKGDVFEVVDGPLGKIKVDKTTLDPIVELTAAGYKLSWYNPTVGWTTSTARPGSDWYGPLRWDSSGIPVEYWIDTRNIPSGISESSFTYYVQKCYQTWEDDPNSDIDYTYRGTRTDSEWGVDDGVNIFCWRYIDGTGGTLGTAMTNAQYTPGNYDSFRINDVDIRLDTGDLWSAADTCPSDKFDVQNVGTHEVGHNVGLADLYDPEDTAMTMYGYASPGE